MLDGLSTLIARNHDDPTIHPVRAARPAYQPAADRPARPLDWQTHLATEHLTAGSQQARPARDPARQPPGPASLATRADAPGAAHDPDAEPVPADVAARTPHHVASYLPRPHAHDDQADQPAHDAPDQPEHLSPAEPNDDAEPDNQPTEHEPPDHQPADDQPAEQHAHDSFAQLHAALEQQRRPLPADPPDRRHRHPNATRRLDGQDDQPHGPHPRHHRAAAAEPQLDHARAFARHFFFFSPDRRPLVRGHPPRHARRDQAAERHGALPQPRQQARGHAHQAGRARVATAQGSAADQPALSPERCRQRDDAAAVGGHLGATEAPHAGAGGELWRARAQPVGHAEPRLTAARIPADEQPAQQP